MKNNLELPDKNVLIADIVAGLSVASILLPEAVAYAAIAHLSIEHAITAVLIGLVCYACLGGSQFAIVAPTSSAAALMASMVVSLHPPNDLAAANLAFALVMLTGVGLLIFAQARLGRLSAFVSRPVLRGFSFALALTIIAKQLPILFGVPVHAPDVFHMAVALVRQASDISPWSVLVGCSALILLRSLKRWPNVPAACVVLALGISLNYILPLADFHIAIVGAVHIQAPSPTLSELTLNKWLQLAEMACGLLVIIVAESWGSIRSLALSHNSDAIEPNRELLALGTANLISGLCQGLPVGAGFSASMANEQAGAQSKMAGLVAAFLLLALVICGQAWLSLIPEPIVAAAVINALSHALNPKSIIYLWQMNRDQYLAVAVIIAVLAFGVLHGMLMGVGLSLVAAIRSFSQPLVKELAELDHSRDYVDKEAHPSALSHAGILILRPEEPLFFASVEGIVSEMHRRLTLNPEAQILIISLEESANFDSTATDCLIEFAHTLKRQNKKLLLARVKDPIRFLLLKLDQAQFQDTLFWSVNDAVVYAATHQESNL